MLWFFDEFLTRPRDSSSCRCTSLVVTASGPTGWRTSSMQATPRPTARCLLRQSPYDRRRRRRQVWRGSPHGRAKPLPTPGYRVVPRVPV